MPKRILEGVTVSAKSDKTVIVKVERTFLHPVLKKTIRKTKKYHAHDEASVYKASKHAQARQATLGISDVEQRSQVDLLQRLRHLED